MGIEPSESWQDVHETDIEAVARLLRRGEISIVSGGHLARFEKQFAAFAGGRHAVATNNGTAAIHAALWAAGVRSGDEVAVCDYGFHGMAAAVRSLGALVVPVDAEPLGLTMDPQDLTRAVSERTAAILVHNPWGIPADFAALRAAAPGIPLIADASHAHGALYRGEPLAAHADIACFSLGRGKLVSGGELGCAVTRDPELHERMLVYGHVNRVPGDLKTLDWTGSAVGLKLRPHPVALVLALGQLKRYPEKQALQCGYAREVEAIACDLGLVPLRPCCDAERVYWRILLGVPEALAGTPEEVAAIAERLRRAGVAIEPNHYWPTLQHQSLFEWDDHRAGIRRRPCPVAARIAPRLLTLPARVQPPADALERLRECLTAVLEGDDTRPVSTVSTGDIPQ